MKAPARILIVDDEPLIQRLIARTLSARGYEVECEGDGKRALEWATTAEPAFDLVITNSRMPNMGGVELVRRLRERFPALPIIHLSGSHAGPLAPNFAPDIPTIKKPFLLEELVGQVERLLALKHRPTRAPDFTPSQDSDT